MPVQLTAQEQVLVERTVRNGRGTAAQALAKINRARTKTGIEQITKASVYRFINGTTHVRGQDDTRGRPKILTKGDIRRLDQARKRLLKEADGEYQVKWQDVQNEAGLANKCCGKVVQQAMRKEGIGNL
jgi:hypothetical protein